MKIRFALAVCLTLLVSACAGEGPTQTVEWYKANEVERTQMIAECSDDRGSRELAPNCVNAGQAQNEIDNSRRGMSPLTPLSSD